MGLALPLFGLVDSLAFFLFFYLATPIGLDPVLFLSLVFWLLWAVVVWSYLRRPYVKEFPPASFPPAPA